MKLGADPNFATTNGRTPVAFVAGGNDDQLFEILLENGSDPDSRNADNQPAIFAAFGQERLSQIEMLIEFGADLNFTDGPNRNSAHYVAFLNKYEIVYYLIDQGADHTNRNSAGGDIAWLVPEGLSENILSLQFPAYEWAKKVKEQLQDRGVNFPPPSPKEVRQTR